MTAPNDGSNPSILAFKEPQSSLVTPQVQRVNIMVRDINDVPGFGERFFGPKERVEVRGTMLAEQDIKSKARTQVQDPSITE